MLLINSIANGQIKYFNENGLRIEKQEFNNKISSRKYLSIPGDSADQEKLIFREQQGQIDSIAKLIKFLTSNLNIPLISQKLIVILYYPGQDECNSGGIKDFSFLRTQYKEMEEELYTICQCKPIYIFKNDKGLNREKELANWQIDPGNLIGREFFPHHYPCGSFIVISPGGKFISYLGEYPRAYVLKAAKSLLEY